MNKSIAALIRLQGWRCEDGRRAVLAARARIDSLQAQRQRLSETLADERRTARTLSADAVIDIAVYERRLAAEDAAFATELNEAEAQHSAALDDLSDALAEKRKLELAEAHYHEAAQRVADRRERSALDEIALHRHTGNMRTTSR